MHEEAFILIDYVDLRRFDRRQWSGRKCIAMTPGAMQAFELAGQPYEVFEDYYGHHQFRKDNQNLETAAEILFKTMDRHYEQNTLVPRTVVSNIYWFLGFFSNIFYISRVAQAINEKFSAVYICASRTYEKKNNVKVDLSASGLNMSYFNPGLENRVNMLLICLKKYHWTGSPVDPKMKRRINLNRGKYLVQIVFRKILKKLKTTKESRVSENIFVIQDGYEVEHLRNYLTDYNYINPGKDVQTENLGDMPDFPMPLFHDFENFVSKWFPNCTPYIMEVFNQYHRQVACLLPQIKKRVEAAFDRYQPRALMYSIFSHNPVDDIFAWTANQKGIPVFYFQHGGTRAFYEHGTERFTEQNNFIEKINIFQSRQEKEVFTNQYGSKGESFGSMKYYQRFNKPAAKPALADRALFCPGPFTFNSYKDLMSNTNDQVLFELHKEVIQAAKESGIRLDIKVAPADEHNNVSYFKNLSKSLNAQTVNILSGFPVETVLDKYGLIILDYVPSALFPLCLTLKKPVVAFFKDLSFIRKESLADIKERFYLVQQKSELAAVLEAFQKNQLESKFSLQMVDRYAFDVAIDPGENIAAFIKEVIQGKGPGKINQVDELQEVKG